MQEKNNIKQFTDKYEFTNPITRILIKRFFKTIISLCPQQINTVLEVGCGAGYSTQVIYNHLKPKVFFASDIDPELVSLTKERVPEVSATSESIYTLSHKDKSFDIVFTLEVMEHLEQPNIALKEIKRVTNRYAIISVPNEPLWRILNLCRGKYIKDFGNTPGHINHWSKSKFKKFLSTEFKVKQITTSIPWIIALVEKY